MHNNQFNNIPISFAKAIILSNDYIVFLHNHEMLRALEIGVIFQVLLRSTVLPASDRFLSAENTHQNQIH